MRLTSKAAAVGFTLSALAAGPAVAANVVLVHGMNMDGSVWLPVHRELVNRGHKVTIVQLPMTSAQADIDAARRAIRAQDGQVVLVGHSYGGMVISQAGTEPGVVALVFVAALQPEVGESLASLNSSEPSLLPADASIVFDDGFYVVERGAWIANVANGLPQVEAEITADFQTPVNTQIFGYQAEAAAWRDLPSWYVVATEDRTVSPVLQRRMADRSGATAVQVETGHLPQLTKPLDVVRVIEQAVQSADR